MVGYHNITPMKTILISQKGILLLVFLIFINEVIGQQWTLESCVKQAINNHPDVKNAQLNLSIFKTKLDQSIGNYYPELSANVFQSGNFGRSIDRFTNAYIDQFYNTTYAGVRMSIPVFTSFRNSNLVQSAKSLNQASEYGLEKNINILTFTIIAAYINTLSQSENIRNVSNQIKNDSVQYQRMLIRKEIGLTTKIEEIQLMNQMRADELSLLDAQLSYETAVINLSQLMNTTIPITVKLSPLEPDLVYNFENQVSNFDFLPQISEFRFNIKSMEETINATKAISYPSISLNADYGTFYASSNPERTFTQQLNDTRNGSISLGLNIPILRGLKNRPQVQELKLQQMALQNSLDKTKLLLKQEIETAKARYKTFKKRYENALFMLELARENMILISEQLNVGTVTMVDFLIAQNNMDKASSNLTHSKYQLILQEKFLKFYVDQKYDLD